MAFDIDRLRVKPGKRPDLTEVDTRSTPGWDDDKDEGKERHDELTAQLGELQEILYAEGKQRLLIVLQAMDAGGKDSTIGHVLSCVNPSGVKIASFKRPSTLELAHDFLWRVHAKVPGDGEIVVFNRSHYEDVLVVRVDGLVPEKVWRRRYEHIRNFESMLADEGTRIVKIMLHISPDEQKERLQDRLDRPDKHWKFEKADLAVRAKWGQYMDAFADALGETSTEDAPWYVIPADRKWYRNMAVSEILVQTLTDMAPEYPPSEDLSDVVIPDVSFD